MAFIMSVVLSETEVGICELVVLRLHLPYEKEHEERFDRDGWACDGGRSLWSNSIVDKLAASLGYSRWTQLPLFSHRGHRRDLTTRPRAVLVNARHNEHTKMCLQSANAIALAIGDPLSPDEHRLIVPRLEEVKRILEPDDVPTYSFGPAPIPRWGKPLDAVSSGDRLIAAEFPA